MHLDKKAALDPPFDTLTKPFPWGDDAGGDSRDSPHNKTAAKSRPKKASNCCTRTTTVALSHEDWEPNALVERRTQYADFK
jgi:hypothetical protein